MSNVLIVIAIFVVAILVVMSIFLGAFFIVKQQEVVIIERFGKFSRIVAAGFRFKIPYIETIAARVSLRTHKEDFNLGVKTKDNVTVKLVVSAQYHVDFSQGTSVQDSGIYRSYYMLASPISQMKDYLSDALRSATPNYTLDEVFERKDDIARNVNESVSATMGEFGWTLVSTLITGIVLPETVEKSMNEINAAQRQREAAQSLADADKIKRVTEAQAEAEAMEKTGTGIANQRIAIAQGIKESLDVIHESGVSMQEANELFLYTQWAEMMTDFAKGGKSSTVVLPADFEQSRGMFSQMVAAKAVGEE